MQTQKILLLFLAFICSVFTVNAQLPNDSCADAILINMGTNCLEGTNEGALNDTIATCTDITVMDVWYRFNATASGLMSLHTDVAHNDSLFNDVLSIYSGGCNNLVVTKCTNYDEYGFQGEKAFFEVVAGETYLVQISGQLRNFGKEQGKFCLSLANETALPELPNNDLCTDAISLTVNDDWQDFYNHHATTDSIFADELERSRADIWFQFSPQNGELIKTAVQADFSHILALYEGDCDNLTLINQNINGFELIGENLNPNETYFVQISGRFATLEGDFQIKIEDELTIAENYFCQDATPIQPDGNCVPFDNAGVTFSDITPSCFLFAAADFWYKYSPLQSGSFQINTHADYEHGIAVYTNTCDSLVEIYCSNAYFPCAGYVESIDVEEGNDYFIQIITNNTYNASVIGSGCLEIISDLQSDNALPLSLEVSPFCLTDSTAELKINVSGGVGNYTYYGNQAGEILPIGSPYFVQVIDENGCQEIVVDNINCSELPNDCDFFYYLETSDISCHSAADGTATISVADGTNPTFSWSNEATTATVNNLSAGTHFVEMTSDAGAICTVYFDISAPDSLSAITTIFPANSGTNTTDLITILPQGGTPPYSFLWETGETTQSKNFIQDENNDYLLTDANGCTFVHDVFIIDNTINRDLYHQIQLYPNPVNDLLFVEIGETLQLEQVVIYDNLGRIVLQRTVPQLNVAALPGGPYFVKVVTNKGQIFKRIIIL